METLVDLLEGCANRYGDRSALGLRRDDGTRFHWSYREVRRRSRLAAWRLRALGLQPGDRVLTWSPSTPALPAAYFGAMYARLIYVPLDSRMSTEAIRNIIEASGAVRLLLGTGRDAPDPAEAGLGDFPTTSVDSLSEEPDDTFPADWEAQVAAWEHPKPDEVFQLVFTSGTTGNPKGVMLAHDNVLAGVSSFHRIIQPMDHRLVSLLPLSHSLEQAVSLFYAMDVGADILYVRSRNPRVIFDSLREHRVTTMLLVPQVLDLFWSAIEREVEKQGRTATFAAAACASPAGSPTGRGASCSATCTGSSAAGCACSRRPARSCRPRSSRRGRTWASSSSRVTARPRPRPARARRWPTTRWAASGGRRRRSRCGSPTTARSSSAARRCSRATGTTPRRRPRRSPTTAGTRAATSGQLDAKGRLHLHGRKKDIIVLPNGFNVYPEDLENALRVAGVRDSVALETRPGRIEAIVLGPGGGPAAGAGHAGAGADGRGAGDHRRRRSRPPTRRSARASGSPAGASGPRRTSRAPTRSRSSATRSARGRPTRRRCR